MRGGLADVDRLPALPRGDKLVNPSDRWQFYLSDLLLLTVVVAVVLGCNAWLEPGVIAIGCGSLALLVPPIMQRRHVSASRVESAWAVLITAYFISLAYALTRR